MTPTSPKSLALTISIALHLILLATFAAIKLSSPKAERAIPQASITQLSAMANAEPITPKPKINRLFVADTKPGQNWQLPLEQLSSPDVNITPEITKLELQNHSPARSEPLPRTTQFFGNRTSQKKICFVVDCSGSMKGFLKKVQNKLSESISQLEPDQFFAIIFFGNGRITAFENAAMSRATEIKKQKAIAFINTITLSGKTEPLLALQKAMSVRDSVNSAPGMIYLLTDATFELDSKSAKDFCDKALALRAKLAPATQIHPIMFWPQQADKEVLSTLAQKTSGQFTAIE